DRPGPSKCQPPLTVKFLRMTAFEAVDCEYGITQNESREDERNSIPTAQVRPWFASLIVVDATALFVIALLFIVEKRARSSRTKSQFGAATL
ncbi:MAG TPA: hypothetical protein PLS03_08515, partial [Terrimicrobiaceae bacterium]|nr:hypothetical protein [Terrimicrobiaceae bacterium]